MRKANQTHHISCIAAVIILSLAVANVRADWLQQDKMTASDAAAYRYFGNSVSISGDYAIAGAVYADGNNTYSGAAYIYKRSSSDPNWPEQAKLIASDGDAYDVFGMSVSISGDYAIVGTTYADGNDTESGAAYIFKRNGTSWTQQAKLIASDGKNGDRFGVSVSIDGDYTIVGAYYDQDKGFRSGSAYIFKRDGTTWTQQAKLVPWDLGVQDCFGQSVAISGEYAIIGAPYSDYNSTDSGVMYIYKRSGTTWTLQTKLAGSDTSAFKWFGYSVSISGNYAIIGQVYDNDKGYASGSAYIFKRASGSWSQQDKITASDGAPDDQFGWSVSISGDLAIVGTPWNDDMGWDSDSGSAYIFQRSDNIDDPNWYELAKVTASDAAVGDRFGQCVSISGESAIVAAHHNDDNGDESGSAYIFEKTCPTADLNGDCCVDYIDLDILCASWLQSGAADLDGSGTVNFVDYAKLALQWQKCN